MAEMRDRPSPKTAVLFMLCSATAIAGSSFFAERSVRSAPAETALFLRFLLPLALVSPLALAHGLRLPSKSGAKLHTLRAAFLVCAQYCFMRSAQQLGLTQAFVLYNTGPLFIVLGNGLLRRQRESALKYTGAALGFAGVCLALGAGLQSDVVGSLFGLGAGASVAVSQLSLHASSQRESPLQIVFYTSLFASAVSLPFWLFASTPPARIGAAFLASWFPLCAMAIGSILNQAFRSAAYRRVETPSLLAPLIYTSIPIATLFDAASSTAWPGAPVLAGSALVFLGATLPLWERRA